MAEIDLMLDEENELTFQLNIQGTRPGEATCRLVLENTDMALSFDSASINRDEVTIILPSLKHVLKEGSYDMSLEVIIDDRYFKPLTLTGNFEKSISVMAEAVTKPKRKKTGVTSASLVNIKNKSKKDSPRVVKERNTRNDKNRKNTTSKQQVTDQEILNIIKALSRK